MKQKHPSVPIQERLSDCYLLLLMTVLVFAFSSGGYLNLMDAKWTVFLILSGGYVGLCLLLLLEETLVGQRRFSALPTAVRQSTWPRRLMAAFLVLTCLSALLSPYAKTAWLGGTRREGALAFGLYVCSFLLLSRFGRPKRWMAHVLAVTVALQAVLCILQLHGANPLSLYPQGVNYFDANKAYSGAYLGTIGNVDFLGAYFCLTLPILWVSLLRMKSPWRFAYLIPLALGVYVAARMWVLSCVVGLVLGGALSLPVVLPAERKTRRIVAICLLAAAVVAVLTVYLVDFGGPLHAVHALLHGDVAGEIDSGRLYIWREVLRRVPERLLFGAGPDTLSLAEIAPFERYDDELGMMLYGKIDSAHCEYLNILYHQGVFALAAYLGGLLAALWTWVRAARKNSAAAILGTAALCYAIQAAFNISMYFTASLFWCALGLLDGCCAENDQERKGTKQ